MSNSKSLTSIYRILVMIVDLAIVNFSIYLAFVITFALKDIANDQPISFLIPAKNFDAYLQLALPITLLSLIVLDLVGLYRYYRKTWQEILTGVFYMAVIEFFMIATLSYFTQTYGYPRSVMLLSPCLLGLFLFTFKYAVSRMYRNSRKTAKVMVVGDEGEASKIAAKMVAHSNWKQEIAYIFSPQEIKRITRRFDDADEIVICPNVEDDVRKYLLDQCIVKGKFAFVVPQVEDILISRSRVIQFDDLPAFMIEKLELTWEQRFVKRLFDIVLSSFAILISWPVMLVCMIAIKATSPGPAIFAQERVTRGSELYRMYKFRSMRIDAEAAGPAFSSKDDPRVTKVGRVLRKFRLDEFPQFFNILKGEMSFVGPRAERPYFIEQISKETPQFHYRTNVKAGLTGLAQIRGNYDTDLEDKLRYDLLYITNFSVLYDLVLIFRTIGVIITGHTHGA